MLTSARLTLKLHRFEVAAASLAAILLGLASLIVVYRLNAVHVPPGCFDAWLSGGGAAGAGDCGPPVQLFGEINEGEAGKIFAAFAILPFAVGLLGGVPLVGDELEARTAQTAWSLNASRLRWLGRQLAPVLVVLGITVTFAALAANLLEATREPWYHHASDDLTLHGLLVVVRAFAALSLGLLIGALVGRTLPAFILGAVLSLALVSTIGAVREQWLFDQKAVVGNASTGEPPGWHGTTYGSVWLSSDGTQLDDAQAIALVPAGTPDAVAWLEDRGYRLLPIGVSDEVAMSWGQYDAFGFGLVGATCLAAAMVVVNRRRLL
jgi:hypothetical protein